MNDFSYKINESILLNIYSKDFIWFKNKGDSYWINIVKGKYLNISRFFSSQYDIIFLKQFNLFDIWLWFGKWLHIVYILL